MTELETLAAAILKQWHATGESSNGPITVAALLDDILPYRIARRMLGIDVSEDFEALVLRLLAEQDDLVRVDPVDAADLARDTVGSRMPDLDVLQLLRAATITVTDRTVRRLRDMPTPTAASKPNEWQAPEPADETPPAIGLEGDAPVSHEPIQGADCWSCHEALPSGRVVKFCPFCGADQREPTCPSCGAQVERVWSHCPDCGTGLRGPS